MRILVGSIQQETNSFSPVRPAVQDFDYLEDEAVLAKIPVTPLFEQAGAELVPTIYANAVPSGRISRADYEELCSRLLDRIPADGGLDGVWLYCHGAMDVEGLGSGELYLIRRIREKVGLDIPLAVALDFHANIRPELMDYVNVVCGYRTAPHRDMEETQLRAGRHLLTCIREHLLPHPALVRIPMMLTGDMVITDRPPMREIMDMALAAEDDPEMLDASVFNGQNWVDIPHAGASVVVTPRRDTSAAGVYAAAIARRYWEVRGDFRFLGEAYEPEETVENAMAHNGDGPVFLSDSGDNTTAGAAGDNTELLRILLEKGATDTAVVGVTDAPAVDQLYAMDIGAQFVGEIGGTLSKSSQRISVRAQLLHKCRILGWDGFDAGRAAVVRSGGIDIVLTENRTSVTNPQILQSVGIALDRYKIITVKLGYLYPALEKVALRHIIAFTNGVSSIKIEKMPFAHIPHPMYPFDRDFEWDTS